jgi:DNA replication protein DnaC
LLKHHLKRLKLPTILRECEKQARYAAESGLDHLQYLARLLELECIDRERRTVERRIKAARFPVVKTIDSYDFTAAPSVNKTLVRQLARCEWIDRHENTLLMGNSGTGKTHLALGLALSACQQGRRVLWTTAAALVHELIEANDERRLLRMQKTITRQELLIIDELGYVPLSKTGAELLFEIISQRYENSATCLTTNLPFDEWTSVFGCERLTGALLDRLTHHVHIITCNGDSYRLADAKKRRKPPTEDDGAHE